MSCCLCLAVLCFLWHSKPSCWFKDYPLESCVFKQNKITVCGVHVGLCQFPKYFLRELKCVFTFGTYYGQWTVSAWISTVSNYFLVYGVTLRYMRVLNNLHHRTMLRVRKGHDQSFYLKFCWFSDDYYHFKTLEKYTGDGSAAYECSCACMPKSFEFGCIGFYGAPYIFTQYRSFTAKDAIDSIK